MKAKRNPSAALRAPDPRALNLKQRRRRQFRLLALLLPLLVLAGLEGGLRIFGFGYPTGFFRKISVDNRKFAIDNDRFANRYFPPGLARAPQPQKLALPKLPGTYRIFVFGESAAMGDPEPAFGFARILETLLEAQYPKQRFEVVNVGVTAINSHIVRQIAWECRKREGDLWIIYMGNNEVVGPFGAGTVFGDQVPSLGFIRASLALKATRLGQLLDRLKHRLSRRRAPGSWEGMEMFLQQQVRRSDPRMTVVYQHFQKNLQEILKIGQTSGAQVLVASVVSNLKDCPPFGSLHRPDFSAAQLAEWTRLYDAGRAAEAATNYATAISYYEEAGRLDATYAELHYRLGRCYAGLGRKADARKSFTQARDLDTLRFRVDSVLAELTQAATSHLAGLHFIDLNAVAAAQSPEGMPGGELLHEHVHLNFAGNYLLGRTLAEQIAGLLPARIVQSVTNTPRLLSADECAQRLAYTAFDQQRVASEMLKRLDLPPFTSQIDHEQRQARRRQQLELLEMELATNGLTSSSSIYEAAVTRKSDDWMLHENFARLLQQAGRSPAAEEQWRKVIDLMPHYAAAYYSLANSLDAQGRSAEAIIFFQEALRLRPASVEARNGLGLALSNQGKVTEAEREYRAAIREKPDFAEARINLGQLLAQQGKVDQAAEQYRTVLAANSNNVAARVNLGKLLTQQGKMEQAVREYREALRQDPGHAVAHYNLANALLAQNQSDEALQHYAAAVRTQPDFVPARYNLGLGLARTGKNTEALEQFREVVRLQPDFAEGQLNLGVALAKAGDFQGATRCFREALRLDPNNELARKFLSQAEARSAPL